MSVTDKLLRISPAITFEFEKFASRICDEAGVDFGDRPYKIREWVGRLEQLWRNIIVADEKTTDEDALQIALLQFEPAKNVAKTFRGGVRTLIKRIFTYQRYQSTRVMIVFTVSQLVQFVRPSSFYVIPSADDPDAVNISQPCLNFLQGVGIVALVAFANWQQIRRWIILRTMLFTWAWLLQVGLARDLARLTYWLVSSWNASLPLIFFLLCIVCLALCWVISSICLASEAFRYPDKKQARYMQDV